MRLTAKAKLAVAAMVDLATQSVRGRCVLMDVRRRQGISQSHLEQMFAKLRRACLVKSSRGSGGGYRLGRGGEAVSVADIVRAVDGPPDSGQSRRARGPESLGRIFVDGLWSDASDHMFEFLGAITLSSLAESQAVAERDRDRDAPGFWRPPIARRPRTDSPNSVFDSADRWRALTLGTDRNAQCGARASPGAAIAVICHGSRFRCHA